MIINPKVVDISHYDDIVGGGFVDVRKAGILGVIHKSSEGSGIVDQPYAARKKLATAAGLLFGCYHFIRPGDMNSQADFFLRAAQPDAKTLVSLDYEVDNVSASDARKFIEHVEAKIGRHVVLYSGNTIKEKLGNTYDPWWAARRLWLAQYSNSWTVQKSWKSPWLWQFTGDGLGPRPHSVPGISIDGGLDISSYIGSDDQLRAEWAQDITPVPIPVPQPEPDPTPPPPAASPRFMNITATEFGGANDPQASAYGGRVDGSALQCSLPARIPGDRPKVRAWKNGKSAICVINDVGPWVTNDPYWKTNTRPRAESMGGTNHAGIDLTPAVHDALGIPGKPGYRTTVLDYWEFV